MVKNNVNFVLSGWSNIVEKVLKLWKIMVFVGNGYVEFNIISMMVVLNIVWLVFFKINLIDYKNIVMLFRSV